jgi:hypothetical protein
VEPCQTFSFRFEKGRPFVRSAKRKCLHLYYYFMDRDLELIHVMVQSGFAMRRPVFVNGHNWLANKLEDNGIGFTQVDNAFVWREDVERAQRFGSSRQGCESWRVKVPLPSVARNGRLVYSLLGEVTNRDRRGRRSHGCPVCCREWRGAMGVGLRAEAKAMGYPPNPTDARRRPGQRCTAVGAIGVASKLTGLNISE